MHGIFDDQPSDLFTHYAAVLRFRDRLLGGTPSDVHLIETWLIRNMGVSREEEVQRLTIQTLKDLGVDVEGMDPATEFENLKAAAKAIAGKAQTTMFRRDANGLFIESRQVKAMLREATSILWPSNRGTTKWGSARRTTATGDEATVGGKAPKSYLIESISVEPLRISLGMQEPTGVDLAVQHIIDRNGPRSALSYYEYVEQAEIHFVVRVLRDQIPPTVWPDLWRYAQQHGLGAKRSQDHGRFWVRRWEQIEADEAWRLVDGERASGDSSTWSVRLPGLPTRAPVASSHKR